MFDKTMMLMMMNQHTSGSGSSEAGHSGGDASNVNNGQTSGVGSSSSSISSSNSGSSSINNSSVIGPVATLMGDNSQTAANLSGDVEQDSSNAIQQQQSFVIEWDPPAKNPSLVQYYRIFWRPFGSRELSRTMTNSTWIKLNNLNMNKIYEFVVKAANQHGSSVYSDPLTVKPAEIVARSSSLSSAGLIWFMPSSGSSSLIGRVLTAVCFATLFMFSSLAVVMLLERRGYLKRFGSSKSNGSRISFANPAYSKDADGTGSSSGADGDNITWDSGHSLDILAPTPIAGANNQSIA